MSKSKLVKVDFSLPVNDSVREAELMIAEIRKELLHVKDSNNITDAIHEELYDRTALVLDWVGRMSMPVFAIRDELQEEYERLYCKSPKLALKMFDDHYKKLHQPYNTLKNRCFAIMEELDFEYECKFKKKPNNWNL